MNNDTNSSYLICILYSFIHFQKSHSFQLYLRERGLDYKKKKHPKDAFIYYLLS